MRAVAPTDTRASTVNSPTTSELSDCGKPVLMLSKHRQQVFQLGGKHHPPRQHPPAEGRLD